MSSSSSGSPSLLVDHQADGVSLEFFRSFWTEHLRSRDQETRLYNVLSTAHKSEGGIPDIAVKDLAAAFVANRSSCEMDRIQLARLATSVLCFGVKDLRWH
jgi:hypothetical protein